MVHVVPVSLGARLNIDFSWRTLLLGTDHALASGIVWVGFMQ